MKVRMPGFAWEILDWDRIAVKKFSNDPLAPARNFLSDPCYHGPERLAGENGLL
jgi:hypothetical protein